MTKSFSGIFLNATALSSEPATHITAAFPFAALPATASTLAQILAPSIPASLAVYKN